MHVCIPSHTYTNTRGELIYLIGDEISSQWKASARLSIPSSLFIYFFFFTPLTYYPGEILLFADMDTEQECIYARFILYLCYWITIERIVEKIQNVDNIPCSVVLYRILYSNFKCLSIVEEHLLV